MGKIEDALFLLGQLKEQISAIESILNEPDTPADWDWAVRCWNNGLQGLKELEAVAYNKVNLKPKWIENAWGDSLITKDDWTVVANREWAKCDGDEKIWGSKDFWAVINDTDRLAGFRAAWYLRCQAEVQTRRITESKRNK